jgi:hypothetical protein
MLTLIDQSPEEFKAALRAEAEAQGLDLDELLEKAGSVLPDKLPTEPRKLTDDEISTMVDWFSWPRCI